ncbi:hypothetical protein J4052_09200 [Bacillus toyonensis]|nr:hypothetical protein [Bacillus toyonensis]
MAQSTGDDLVAGETNIAQSGTEFLGNVNRFGFYRNDYVLNVEVSPLITTFVDGIRSMGGQRGVVGSGRTIGVVGEGFNGVLGTSSAPRGVGVVGEGFNGVQGTSTTAIGVSGHGINGVKGAASAPGGIGVVGDGFNGVMGTSKTGIGVVADGPGGGVMGTSSAPRGIGVVGGGFNGVLGTSIAPNGIGVVGHGINGVKGVSTSGTGVVGEGFYGVMGSSSIETGIGVFGIGSRFGVFCSGNFAATGTKSALVPHPDGSHRTLYCMESPESWFEDFGIGKLVNGKAVVHLDPDFCEIVHSENYHVFITPEGDSKGLYVSKKEPTGFEVREQQEGSSTLPFSYRVVAKRKDITPPRLKKVRIADEELHPSISETGNIPQKEEWGINVENMDVLDVKKK